ncbi:hypothetical protein [Cellulomonas sp. KRMCY2]|uniref:hypothetical protein n=1 Tax=Cellulomonas sp. KRMCY2 TaxID=1304865 RepID=UPI00045E663E|nr:hypothetical protein [Cellulomonas sp. KRMCY2]
MRQSIKRVLLVGIATAVIGVPVGAAWAATDDDATVPGESWSRTAPPSWAPEDCQERFDSPEMVQWREEHQVEMQEGRAERQAQMLENREQRLGDGVGAGRMGGGMWDRADS